MASPYPAPTKKWHSNTYQSISPTRPELSANGKTVIVTGGGSGIGAETARSFAQAGAARIALLGRREQPLLDTKASIEHQFPKVEVFVAATDVTNRNQVEAVFAKFVGDSKIDVLVSSAGFIGPQDAIETVDNDKFMDAIQINIQGSLIVAQAFLQYAAKGAVAIEINSNAAHINYGPVFGAYSIGKMAVFRLWDWVGFNHPDITVFHLQPGVVDTAMNKEAGGVEAMGYEDHVSLPGNFNLWLASPEARFLKGKYLWANWDVDELKARAKEIEASPQLTIGLVGWPFQEGNWAFDSKNGAWT